MLKHIEQAMLSLSAKVMIEAPKALASHGFMGISLRSDASRVPDTLAGLRYCKDHRWCMPVYSGHSAKTIYDSPRTNHWARAWHDCIHLELGAELDLVGELKVGWHMFKMTDTLDILERGLLFTEVVGQALHFEKYGAFPDDQRAFALDFINRGYKLGDSYAE